jgi:hypothetical protein
MIVADGDIGAAGIFCCGMALAAPALVGLWLAILVVIRLLNATVFDPDWRAVRAAQRRRIQAWDQWDEEMRARRHWYAELDNPRAAFAARIDYNNEKPDSPANGPHGIIG